MMNKKVNRLEKIVARYNDSYNRFDWETGLYENMEWKACAVQGKKLIMQLIGEMDRKELVAVNIFSLFVNKENWIPHPEKDIRGDGFGNLFHEAVNKLGVPFNLRDNGYGGKTYTLT
ncbi:hypothetical protein BAGA_05270 [Bacillus gaemokensis]|uniref:Uncharacterized protein n=2 Tax=Bacillus gaemokensis TaxID=574375 RepID=A0A073KBH2_9BACI|nr:hypothetical protein BAGA_05270 [Bacillus gaemokensis]KYG38159.1 hypothetical protein AZF08_20310 [Bacillus gaemokensis]